MFRGWHRKSSLSSVGQATHPGRFGTQIASIMGFGSGAESHKHDIREETGEANKFSGETGESDKAAVDPEETEP